MRIFGFSLIFLQNFVVFLIIFVIFLQIFAFFAHFCTFMRIFAHIFCANISSSKIVSVPFFTLFPTLVSGGTVYRNLFRLVISDTEVGGWFLIFFSDQIYSLIQIALDIKI